jgi:hypothetical protein
MGKRPLDKDLGRRASGGLDRRRGPPQLPLIQLVNSVQPFNLSPSLERQTG